MFRLTWASTSHGWISQAFGAKPAFTEYISVFSTQSIPGREENDAIKYKERAKLLTW